MRHEEHYYSKGPLPKTITLFEHDPECPYDDAEVLDEVPVTVLGDDPIGYLCSYSHEGHLLTDEVATTISNECPIPKPCMIYIPDREYELCALEPLPTRPKPFDSKAHKLSFG